MKKLYLFKRAFGDLFKIGKKYYALLIIQSLANQSLPFVGFIYMTRIVHALTIDQLSAIPNLIIQFLGISLVLQLIAGMVQPLLKNEDSLFLRKIYAEPHKKMLTMQFQYAESAEVREQLELVNRNNVNNASSFPMIKLRINELIPRFITIVWGLVLLAPLYEVNMEQLPEQFWWLHPLVILVIFFVLIALSVAIQINTSKKTGNNLQKMFAELQQSNALFLYEDEMMNDVKSGKEIRLYDLTQHMIKNTEADSRFTEKLLSENYKQFRQLVLPASGLFQVMNYFVYAYIGLLVLLGALPVALIIQLSSALSQMVSALPDFIQHTMMMLSSPEGLEQYYDFMDLPDEEVIGSLPVEKRLDNDYRIQTDQLTFAYPGSDELVLKGITESFEVGKKYAIVGENGSGKTTFIKLLTRLYAPTEGTIQMNKIDIKKYDLKEYFNLFGVVFQDYHLLGFSLGQNVSVQPTFNKDKVMDKLKKVGLGDFVKSLPHQLDTFLSTEFDESGGNVSGGQEQKIAIARSLYKDAPIMVLDEPTAALDPITEFEIYQNFDNLVEDKTAFYISHRLSSSKFCDEILVFDNGKIIQRGTHEDLVREDGKYQELWTAQAQYYQ